MKKFQKIKRGLAPLAVCAVAVCASAQVGLADATHFSVGTSSSNSGPYVWGSTLANVINQKQDKVELTAQTTGGYNENLSLVATGKMDIALATGSDLDSARAGRDQFAKVNPEIFSNLVQLFTFSVSTYHYVVRADSDIRTFEDAKGKRFNINPAASSTRTYNMNLIRSLGMSADDFEIFSLSTGKVNEALQDRVIDLSGNGCTVGCARYQQLASTTPIRILNIPDDVFDKMNKIYGGALLRMSVPAGTYPGHDEDIKTYAVSQVLVARKDAPDEEVYAITKAFWENLEDLAKANGIFAGLKLDFAASGSGSPMHPAAKRYFKERGLEID